MTDGCCWVEWSLELDLLTLRAITISGKSLNNAWKQRESTGRASSILQYDADTEVLRDFGSKFSSRLNREKDGSREKE
jgi:hypothetical protein